MPTTVHNLRFEAYDAYIGRPGYSQDGYYGNPITRGNQCLVCNEIHTKPGDTIDCFRTYFFLRIAEDEEFRARVDSLRGKRLGCFCKPRPCHGDVIAEYLNGVCDE